MDNTTTKTSTNPGLVPKMMKALVYRTPGDIRTTLKIEQIPTPTPADDQVLIRVVYAAKNPVEYKIASWKKPDNGEYQILGFDVSGVIVQVGSKVTTLKVGDHVWATPCLQRNGSYAEFVAMDENSVALKPSFLSWEEAAALPLVLVTAWEALGPNQANIQPDEHETVFITAGGGGLGHICLQLCKNYFKASKIFTTASKPDSIKFCKTLGADRVINYRNEDFKTVIAEETESQGVNVMLDSIGGENFSKNCSVLSRGGRVVLVVGSADTSDILFGGQMFGKSCKLCIEYMNTWKEKQQKLLTWLAENVLKPGHVKVHISKIISLEEVPSTDLGSGNIGKVVVKISEP